MATFKIHDLASEFRVEIAGRFAGGCVHQVRTAWQDALNNSLYRGFTVDLTRVNGYDAEGRKLLREMHQHGTQFAAGTPQALVLLQEISTALRRGPTLVQDLPASEPSLNRKENENRTVLQPRSKAAGR